MFLKIKKLNLENFLIFSWLCILFSINSVYINTIPLYEFKSFFFLVKKNYFSLFNTIRFYIPILLLPILVIIFFSQNLKKIDFIIFLFLFYYLWQFIAFFISGTHTGEYPLLHMWSSNYITKYEESLWDNIYLTSNSICILIIISIAKNLDLKTFLKKILLITIIFIGIVSIYLSYNLILESILRNLKFIYNSNFLNSFDWKILEQASPRITGLSRMLLIIYFIIFFYFLNTKKRILFFLTLILLGMLIYKMQARASILGVVILFFLFLVFNYLSLKKKIVTLFFLIVTPIFLFETYYYIKKNKNFLINSTSNNFINLSEQKKSDNLSDQRKSDNLSIDRKSELNRILDIEQTKGSGRVQLWGYSLFLIKEKKIIIGYGPKADRFLLTEFYSKKETTKYYQDSYGNNFLVESNVSNALIYSYLCGGIIGFLTFITINIIVTINIFKNILIEKIFLKKETLKHFSISLLIFLLLRSFFENSFAVFGIDLIFFILNIMIIKQNK